MKEYCMKLLVIRAAFNNTISDRIIEEYRDNILFTYIDYKNMNYFIEKYNIIKYYSFMEILPNIANIEFIDFYQDKHVIVKPIIYNKIKKQKIYHIRELFPLTWLDEKEFNNFIIDKNVRITNIPIYILKEREKDIVIYP